MSAQLYKHYNKSRELLYVGISFSSIVRLAQHKMCSHWYSEIKYIEIEDYKTREEAAQAELKAIKEEKPKYNKHHSCSPVELALFESAEARSLNNQIVHTLSRKLFYNKNEAAALLGVGQTALNHLIEANEITLTPLNSKSGKKERLFVNVWSIIDFLERNAKQ